MAETARRLLLTLMVAAYAFTPHSHDVELPVRRPAAAASAARVSKHAGDLVSSWAAPHRGDVTEPGSTALVHAPPPPAAITGSTAPPPRQVRYMSFYGDAPSAQRGIVNARMWDVWNGIDKGGNPYADIDKHYNDSRETMGAFLDITALVWHRQGCNLSASTLNVSTCGVKPDWQEALSSAVRAARPQLAAGSIVGLFLGDEIQCGGIPAGNVSK